MKKDDVLTIPSLRELHINLEVIGKILIAIEGPTCSGKTTFVSNMIVELEQVGIIAKVIDEAATKLFKNYPLLLEKLVNFPLDSDPWRRTKLELQKKILARQVNDLVDFAHNSDYRIAIMDRSGASTAYHTLPYVKEEEKYHIEKICKEITEMGKVVIFLSSLGFIDEGSPRYQKSLEEIKVEEEGIKYYFNRWGIDYLELTSINRDRRIRSGLKYILKIISLVSGNKME